MDLPQQDLDNIFYQSTLDWLGMSDSKDKELLKEWRNNFKGIRWKDKEGNLFQGAIDNLLKKGDKLIVKNNLRDKKYEIDHKKDNFVFDFIHAFSF